MHSSLGSAFHLSVVTDSDPDATQSPLDLEHEQSRQWLDAQARAWASAARKWLWFLGIAGLTATAACVGFLMS
jgi:hypothetical protein